MASGKRVDKVRLLAELRQQLGEELRVLAAAHGATQAGATHEESRPENDKDTRALEASYLARGQAERVVALREGLRRLDGLGTRGFADDDPVALTALVTLDDGEKQTQYFIAPVGGGIRLSGGAHGPICVVTPAAPLGRALLGKRVGDDVELRTPEGVRDYTIEEVE